ncbi:MAG TPA: hypothetical protein VFQ11_10895 [Nocardioidaceae bacterium]|nr:hypothetical protein [Nocardioidaceae bacterium]
MAKIRGIKPETWTDETFVELTPLARLLFIGMWNYACDNGHLEDRSKQLKMRVLPADDCNVAELLRELENHGRIVRHEGWIEIPTLREHQRIDKRWFATCDKPGCTKPDAENANPQRETRRGHDEATARPQRAHDVATSGPRDELSGVELSGGDGDSPSPATAPRGASTDVEREFNDWWDHYPRKVGKGQARKAYRTARKKASADTLVAAVEQQRLHLTAKGPEFCPHPTTWLNGERWADEPPPALTVVTDDPATLPPVEQTWMRRRPQ